LRFCIPALLQEGRRRALQGPKHRFLRPFFVFKPPLQLAEKVLIVIPSEARDLLFYSVCKKQQIHRANPALRNDME